MSISLNNFWIFVTILLWSKLALAVPGAHVVYPYWFKDSFYDLQADLQDARTAGKQGIMVFFSTETCSYCQAIIETTFKQQDVEQRLRHSYDVIGLEVLSDTEVVDPQGQRHWAKDFAIAEKAKFTPTMIFYGLSGKVQLRLVGYQSAQKMRAVLDYIEGGHFTRTSLREFMQQGQASATPAGVKPVQLDLDRRKSSDRHLLAVFESSDCSKCQLLRAMLQAEVLHPYLQQLDVVFIDSSDQKSQITTPEGIKLSGKTWADQLGLIHTPAMVFFYKQGKEVLRVDTDILVDMHGNTVAANDKYVLDNIRARLQFVVDKGYVTLPQFQRWRAQQKRNVSSQK